METVESECKCSVCEEREQRQRREDEAIVRRTDAAHAAKLFRWRQSLSVYLEIAREVAGMPGAAELGLIPAVISRVGVALEEEIERLADDMPEEHADLAEGIRLFHRLIQQGGDAKYDVGTWDGQQQEQVVITATPQVLDAETWQQLFERRDVLVLLADGSPPPPSRPADDGLPF